MAKFFITIIVVMSLAGSIHMQDASTTSSSSTTTTNGAISIEQGQAPNIGQSPADQLRQFGASNLMNLPNQMQGAFSRIPFLSSLQGNQPSSGGIMQTLQNLPARGMQMLNNMISGVRNMIPGLGRGANVPNPTNGMNLPNIPGMSSLPNMPNLSNLPLGDRLQQGTQTLTNALGSLTNGIRGIIPANAPAAPTGK